MEDINLPKGKPPNFWITTGIIGALASSLCCFTPLAVIFLGVAGLGAWTGYIDYVVLPSLAFSVGKPHRAENIRLIKSNSGFRFSAICF